MRPEYLAYFKDLFEGRAEFSWNAWFARHDEELRKELPRAQYLRLKFQKLDEAERSLRDAGIDFTTSPVARRERYYSLLHPSVCDEKGRPSEAFRRKAYDGAYGKFMDGDVAEGRRILEAYAKKLKRKSVARRAEELADFAFDGSMEFQDGDARLGRAMLEIVAGFELGDDRLDPPILNARQALEERATAPDAET